MNPNGQESKQHSSIFVTYSLLGCCLTMLKSGLSRISVGVLKIQARLVGSYKHEASHQLQAAQSSVASEEPLYNEQLVRKWLSEFPGGAVHLERDESAGVAHLVLDNPKIKNALTGLIYWHTGGKVVKFSERLQEQ